ncbi:hypothetical protein F400_gp057 [Bacillus phage BCD7]|uniref:Uncharacterized protein n=1 Tax=Bacillus phage BCD7 TaxID=1136534 RepID=J9PV74_9CAUD|nr:hypothetical protein F400_gp057 [Bacillus phage BCD7]AEZ50504.1 hypothetical protein BCD7_0057 [Bacillus phage BCD7]
MRRQYGKKSNKRRVRLDQVSMEISNTPVKGQFFVNVGAGLTTIGENTSRTPFFVTVPMTWYDERIEGNDVEVMTEALNTLKSSLMALGVSTLDISKQWSKISVERIEPTFTI